jgi:competence protein ComEC
MKDYPLISIAVCYSLGIILAKFLNLSHTLSLDLQIIIIGVVLLSGILSIFIQSFNSFKSFFILMLFLLFGIVSYSLTMNSLYEYPFKEGKIKDVVAYGTIENIELDREYEIRMFVHLDSAIVKPCKLKLKHSFLVRIRDEKRKQLDLVYSNSLAGNYIRIKGTVTKGREQRNPGEFDYQDYLVQKGISGIFTTYSASDFKILNGNSNTFTNLIFAARKAIDQSISRLHNPQTASLLKGLIVGDRTEISDETKTDFINTGVVHVLAVSGLHVAYILVIFIFVFGRVNIYLRSAFVILGILIFIYITGATASVVRSAIMGIALIVAYLTNRSTNIYNSIALSALIILIINPVDLFDPGLQLSYAAVISIVAFTPFFQRRISNSGIKNVYLKKFLLFCAVSLAAQIGTIPFTLFYFRKLSLISLFANIIIVPLTGGMISLGIFTLILGTVWVNAALIFSSVNNLCTSILYDITHWFSSLQFSYLSISQFTLLNAITFYLIIFVFFYFYEKMSSIKSKIIIFVLVAFNILLFSSFDKKEFLQENKLNVVAIDVGQGDAFLIKFPNGKTALIDAGEANQYFDNGERIILPLLNYFGVSTIDYGFISHVDSDHYSGFIALILKGVIKEIYKPGLDTSYSKDVRLEKFLHDKSIPVHYFNKSILDFGNARMTLLNNYSNSEFVKLKMNNRSGIIKLVYGRNSFLFTGDIEQKAENNLVLHYNNYLKSDLLKLSHHGSSTGSSDRFLDIVNPRYAMISAGQYNKFNHPSHVTLEKLWERNIKPLRTDELGCIILTSDGSEIRNVDWKSF